MIFESGLTIVLIIIWVFIATEFDVPYNTRYDYDWQSAKDIARLSIFVILIIFVFNNFNSILK